MSGGKIVTVELGFKAKTEKMPKDAKYVRAFLIGLHKLIAAYENRTYRTIESNSPNQSLDELS